MTVGILQDIIEKIRELSASGNSSNVLDEKIVKYINSYYLYDFPDDLRILKLKDVYTFNTIQGVDVYPFDFDGWESVNAPAYIAKEQVPLFQDKQSFYSYYNNVQSLETFDTGDGTTGAYSGNTQAFPIRRSVYNKPMAVTKTAPTTAQSPSTYPPSFGNPNISRIQNILISASTSTLTQHVTDDGAGNLIGDCSAGTIDYLTGAIAGLIFNASVPSGENINIQYTKTTLGRPWGILFYQNQFIMDRVPDQAYTVEIEAFREPSQALLGTTSNTVLDLSGRPEEFGWWELIAFGVAKKLYQDRLDMDGVQMMQVFIDEQVSQARTKTYSQLGSRQIPTMYRDATNQIGGPL